MSKSGGYDSYRGRSPMRTFLKGVILLLAAVLVIAVIALLFLQRYIVYSADGIRIDFPFFQNGEASAAPTETPSGPVETAPLVVLTPEPEATPEHQWLHAVTLPREALYDGTAGQLVEEAGGNAAVFDMKSDDGSLGYVSQLPLAIAAKVSSGDPAVNSAIQSLHESGLYIIARVSCFRDNDLSNADHSLAVTTNSGYRWTDSDEVRWVSPTNEEVRRYVAQVCAELAGLGFDEILLDNSGYPTEGKLNYIKKGDAYDASAFPTVIDGFYAQVAEALEGYDIKLSILTDETTVAEGENARSGQTVESLLRYADRVWLPGGDDAAVQTLADAGLQDVLENVVRLSEEPEGDACSWGKVTLPFLPV